MVWSIFKISVANNFVMIIILICYCHFQYFMIATFSKDLFAVSMVHIAVRY